LIPSQASGNKVAAFWPTLFASYIEKTEGIEKFLAAPGAGGGGGGAARKSFSMSRLASCPSYYMAALLTVVAMDALFLMYVL